MLHHGGGSRDLSDLSPGRHPRCMLQLSDESLVICDTWSALDSTVWKVGLDVAGWFGLVGLVGLVGWLGWMVFVRWFGWVGMLFPRFVEG